MDVSSPLRRLFRLLLAVVFLLTLLGAGFGRLRAASPVPAAGTASPSGLWREADERIFLTPRGISVNVARGDVVPFAYRTLTLDRAALGALLATAPREFATRRAGDPVAEIELPIPGSGDFARFLVEESPIMEEGLAVRYPEVRTFVARGIDDPTLFARLDVTPRGFHAMILGGSGQIFIDPYFADGSDLETHIAYYKRDYVSQTPWQCDVHDEARAAREAESRTDSPGLNRPTGASLRIYRLAVGTTGEYSAAVGGSDKIATLAAVITTVNRVDAVYERDFAIRMVLVANEDAIIYTNASTDPYTNSSSNSLLTQNQSTCDSIIGTANYDIGHVFSTAGGGLAGLGVVCNASTKAQGETGTSNPIGDPYDIDYVAHEMGHQFGGNHTFNSTTGSCSGNRATTAAYEPGSGTTIMAYAGICYNGTNVQDLAPHSDDYFHTKSYDEIDAYTTTGTGKNVVLTPIATGNTPPTVATPTPYTIPKSTPFALTASASDPDGDRLTYCWEEFDRGGAVNATSTSGLDNGASPIFRSYAPTTNPTRLFPSLTYILNNANVPPLRGTVDGNYLVGEALPSVARAAGLNFRCTVRDNRVGGGGSNYALVTLQVDTNAGPFAVTAPNTAVSFAGGSVQSVTWNVANTNASSVNCANVKISYSTDGGLTFPYVLAASTPNNGSASVALPDIATQQGRVKIEAIGNIFFDISDANFTVTSANTPPTFAASGGGLTIVRGTPVPASATVGTVTLGSNPLTGVTVAGAPDGVALTAAIVGNGTSIQLSGTAECRVTTTLTSRTYPVSVTVTDAAGATSSGTVNVLIQPNPSPTLGTYANTSVAQNGSVTVAPASGPADTNGNLPASPFTVTPTVLTGGGGTVAINQSTGAVTITPNASSTVGGTTTVRVVLQDTCGAATVKTFTVTVTAATNVAPNFTSSTPTNTAAAGSPYSFTFTASGTPAPTFTVTAGTLPPGLSLNPTTGVLSGTPTTPGVYSGIQVTASNGTAPDATQTFSITVTNTFNNYATSNGLTGGNAAPTADADFDGLSNLLEYALNQPSNANTLAPAVTLKNYSGTNYLSIQFTRVPLATDVSYIVEASPDLASWTTVGSSTGGAALTGAGVVSDSGGNAPLTVEVRDTVAPNPTTAPQRFLRLRVTQP